MKKAGETSLIELRDVGARLEVLTQSLPDSVFDLAFTGAGRAALNVLLNFHAQHRVKLVVQKREQILAHFAASHRIAPIRQPLAFATPDNLSLSARRARAIRDMTVPTGQSSVSAISR